jgi:tetratricopeptide (TPR) repeat protein
MRGTKICMTWLMMAAATGTAAWAQDTPEKSAAVHLAGVLVNDARDALRNSALPPEAAAVEARVLLQFAVKQDGSDVRTWRLLAEAARVTGKTDVQRDALRKVIAADAGDLVSQVHYIELLASSSQTVQERADVYQKALAEPSLDRQIRSQCALQLGLLEESRGDLGQARQYLNQAVQLNDVNVGALRNLVRLAAQEKGPGATLNHGRALVTLLLANSYQADAWLQLGRICAAAGVRDRGADFLDIGRQELESDGAAAGGDFWLELAIESGTAGQRVRGYQLAETLAELPDAPLAPMLVAELLAQNLTAAGTPLPLVAASAGTQPGTQPGFQRVPEIRRRLAELARHTDNTSSLADAAGADLMVLAAPGPDTTAWIDAYAKLVAPEDITLARLRGWLLYRQGKLDEARTTLEKIAASDPVARLGVARILIDQGKTAQARGTLQELWNGNPTGILALGIALTAQQAKVMLSDSPAAQELRPALAKITPAVMGMFRQPRDMQLMDARFRKDVGSGTVTTGVGESVMLQVRMTNTSVRPLCVGPDGMLKTTIGLGGTIRTAANAQPIALGLYAIEDMQRVFRLEPQQMIEGTVRVDQGKLADLLQQNPRQDVEVNVTVVTAPRVLNSQQYSVGVGGQVILPGDVRRAGFPLESKAQWGKLSQEVSSLNGDRQLIRIEVADAALGSATDETLKSQLGTALAALATSSDARVRATLVRGLPSTGVSAELEKAAAQLANDVDPLVRLLWATREARKAMAGGTGAAEAVGNLEKLAAQEKDEAVKQWLEAQVAVVKGKK